MKRCVNWLQQVASVVRMWLLVQHLQLCASDVSLSTSPGGVSVRILPHTVTEKVGQNEDERKLGEAALQARRIQRQHQLKLHRNFGSVVAVRGVLAAVALARW